LSGAAATRGGAVDQGPKVPSLKPLVKSRRGTAAGGFIDAEAAMSDDEGAVEDGDSDDEEADDVDEELVSSRGCRAFNHPPSCLARCTSCMLIKSCEWLATCCNHPIQHRSAMA
jgi:hypothetical protein